MTVAEFKREVNDILRLIEHAEWLERELGRQEDRNDALAEENRRLKYEYRDSKRKRDTPLPYKWRYEYGTTWQYCPKCECMISNWQSYCHSCGQKIKQGNPEPDMEIKDDGTDNARE